MSHKAFSALALLGLFATGCASTGERSHGFIYSDIKEATLATSDASASRTGQACAQSILGAVATGDMSIDAAKRAGGITRVSSVDEHHTNILGVYATGCTIVRGN